MCLVFEYFINSSMGGNLPYTLTTSHSHPFWGQKRGSLHWQQPGYSVGLCYCLLITIRLNTNLPGTMAMLMAFPDYYYLQTLHLPPPLSHPMESVVILTFLSFDKLRHFLSLPCSSKQQPAVTQYSVVFYIMPSMGGHIVSDQLKAYHTRQNELALENGCVMWGVRVIVPKKLQQQVLNELHQSHPGMARMRTLAHSHVWWPNLDHDIESLVKACSQCQSVRSSPPVAPLHPWSWPTRPWQRIHVDYAGPFRGRNFLIVVDAHSKWPEVIPMVSTTSSATIHELRCLFSSFGLPEQLVSDNGPQFTADEFKEFLKANHVKHIRSTPYHPSSNGAAERFVRTFKQALRTGHHPELTFHQQLMSFLLSYRTTPHTTT